MCLSAFAATTATCRRVVQSMHVRRKMHIRQRIRKCMYVFMYACMYLCMYVCTYDIYMRNKQAERLKI
jgi:hypothetical protein